MDTKTNTQKKTSQTIEGEVFYDSYMPDSLAAARQFAGPGGFIASMPFIIDLRLVHPFTHKIWNGWFTANSEEMDGKLNNGKQVILEIHGGGILTQEGRLERAYADKLTAEYGARLSPEEVKNAIYGRLPDGTTMPVYSLAEIKRGVEPTERVFGIVLDADDAKKTQSPYLTLDDMLKSDILLARCASEKRRERYVIEALTKYNVEKLGFMNRYKKENSENNQGRFLIVGTSWDDCFDTSAQSSDGGFIGVQVKTQEMLARNDARITIPPDLQGIRQDHNSRVYPTEGYQ
jgi:hypothetical protein